MATKGQKAPLDLDVLSGPLLEKLSGLEGISSKRMFGGVGIFIDGKMFAMVTPEGQYALKTSKDSCRKYEAIGAEKFRTMPYHTIPDRIWNDQAAFMNWVEEAIQIALS